MTQKMLVWWSWVYTIISDGGWSEWVQFESCSLTCGGGLVSRSRFCENPTLMNGGKDCVGPSLDSIDCNTQPCPTTNGTQIYVLSNQILCLLKLSESLLFIGVIFLSD